jgi:hypothetical protein
MKSTLSIIALSLLLTACSKSPSDSQIRQKFIGTWKPDASPAVFTAYPDGDLKIVKTNILAFAEGSHTEFVRTNSTMHETWKVENGFVIWIYTNVMSVNPQGRIMVVRYKVVRIDDHEMVSCIEGQTNLLTAHRQ